MTVFNLHKMAGNWVLNQTKLLITSWGKLLLQEELNTTTEVNKLRNDCGKRFLKIILLISYAPPLLKENEMETVVLFF